MNLDQLEYERVPNHHGGWVYRIHGFLYVKKRIRNTTNGEVLDLVCKYTKKLNCKGTISINNDSGECKSGAHTCLAENLDMEWERICSKAEDKMKKASLPPSDVIQLSPRVILFKNYSTYCRVTAMYAERKASKVEKITVLGAENFNGIEQKAFLEHTNASNARLITPDGEAELIKTIVERLKANNPMSNLEIKNMITILSQQKPDHLLNRLTGPPCKQFVTALRKKYHQLFYGEMMTITLEFKEDIKLQDEKSSSTPNTTNTNTTKKIPIQTQKKSESKREFEMIICRFCMEVTNQKYNIPQNFYYEFEKFTGVSLDESERFPKILCEKCHVKFSNFLEFLQEILTNQRKFQKMFGESSLIMNNTSNIQYQQPTAPELNLFQDFGETEEITIKAEPQEIESEVFEYENVFVDNLSVLNDQEMLSDDNEDKSYNTPIDEEMKIVENCKTEEVQVIDEDESLDDFKPHWTPQLKDLKPEKPTIRHYCDVCGSLYWSKEKLDLHMLRKHVENSIFECKECPEFFKNYETLKYHILANHKLGEFKCIHCSQIFDTIVKLRKHIPSHDPQVICSICGKFYLKGKLSSHMRQVHHEDKQACEICGKVCGNKQKLSKHISRTHNKSNTKFTTTLISGEKTFNSS